MIAACLAGSLVGNALIDKYFEHRRNLPQLDGSEILGVAKPTYIQCPAGTVVNGGPITRFHVLLSDTIRFQNGGWYCEATGTMRVPLKALSVLKAYQKGKLVRQVPPMSTESPVRVTAMLVPFTKDPYPKIVKTKKELLREDPFGVGSPNDED